jgi:hypothetical protein
MDDLQLVVVGAVVAPVVIVSILFGWLVASCSTVNWPKSDRFG